MNRWPDGLILLGLRGDRRSVPLLLVSDEDVGLVHGVPAIAAHGVVGQIRRHQDGVPIDRQVSARERDLALEEAARRKPFFPAEAGEDHDRKPGRAAVMISVDEGQYEVEDAVVVQIASDEIGVIDAVKPADIAVTAAIAPAVVIGRDAQFGMAPEEFVDRGLLLRGEDIVARLGRRTTPLSPHSHRRPASSHLERIGESS